MLIELSFILIAAPCKIIKQYNLIDRRLTYVDLPLPYTEPYPVSNFLCWSISLLLFSPPLSHLINFIAFSCCFLWLIQKSIFGLNLCKECFFREDIDDLLDFSEELKIVVTRHFSYIPPLSIKQFSSTSWSATLDESTSNADKKGNKMRSKTNQKLLTANTLKNGLKIKRFMLVISGVIQPSKSQRSSKLPLLLLKMLLLF